MDPRKRNLKGSESRDEFKRRHKDLDKYFYACDIDFVLVEKNPPGIVGFIDLKLPYDKVTFSEVLAYNELTKLAPVYIIETPSPTHGPFLVKKYLEGDWKPEPPYVKFSDAFEAKTWEDLERLEGKLRRRYRNRLKKVK